MKRTLLVFITVFTVACTIHTVRPVLPVVQPAPHALELKVEKSIARLTLHSPESLEWWVCTAFSIGERKYLTAAHCVIAVDEESGEKLPNAELRINGIPAFVLKADTKLDLAVVLADLIKPTLELRDAPLQRFEDVHAVGFGEGFLKPIFTDQRVMLLDYTIRTGVAPGTVFIHPFVGGMSGGPIYDNDGLVVGIVQRASDSIGYSVSVATIKDFLSSI